MKISRNIIVLSLLILGFIALPVSIYNFKYKLTEQNSVPLYFLKTDEQNEQQISLIRRRSGKNRIEFAIKELLKGPSSSEQKRGYFSEIPTKTKLIEIRETPEKVVIINLSHEFEVGGGSATMSLRMDQLINTVLGAADGTPVFLELEGQQIDYIGGEGIAVPQPLKKPES